MYQTGIVEELSKDMAKIRIQRSTACGETCASCGMCPAKDMVISALNKPNAKVGDTVSVYLSDAKILKAAFLVYIIPIIMLVIGYAIGIKWYGSENAGILFGFVALIVSFVLICFLDRYLKRKFEPSITKII